MTAKGNLTRMLRKRDGLGCRPDDHGGRPLEEEDGGRPSRWGSDHRLPRHRVSFPLGLISLAQAPGSSSLNTVPEWPGELRSSGRVPSTELP